MDNCAKADFYRTSAQRSRDQAAATNDEGIRAIMSLLATEYDELADLYLRLAEAAEKRLKSH